MEDDEELKSDLPSVQTYLIKIMVGNSGIMRNMGYVGNSGIMKHMAHMGANRMTLTVNEHKQKI